MTTIRDIAKMAGVSVASVSRVINNTGRVGEATRKRIQEIIKQTNYVPNQTARTLYQKKFQTDWADYS
ncbi:LacI family DNA-binding transcriptional regulator [Secundilactobacillus collinoides]|uniref:LacI family DNA-binding transcriptional regulator n=1 Tax=Secundilactobacillus collinoides TaxID=33960 RepID=UPI0006D2543C